MSSSSAAPSPLPTASVLLETSAGALVVDLHGLDCPSLTGAFANLARAKFFNGAVATEVIPDVAVFFSHAADEAYDAALMAAAASASASASSSSNSPAALAVGAGPGEAGSHCGMNDFWWLAGDAARSAAWRRAAAEEGPRSKRRLCTAVARGSGGGAAAFSAVFSPAAAGRGAGALGRKGLLIVEAVAPAAAATASSRRFRFGVTLSDRAVDFLEHQYVAIGAVREGHAVLERIRRRPHSSAPTAPPSASPRDAAGGAASWPRPLRLLRLKHLTVLPTPGAEGAGRGGEGGQRLRAAGCFTHWAPTAAVAAVARRVVARAAWDVSRGAAAASSSSSSCLVLPPAAVVARGGGAEWWKADVAVEREADVLSVEYNPHHTAGYLSSDDADAGDEDGGQRRLRGRELAARRQAAQQLHQSKANETLSLMLNILNGVADVAGDLQPPETVLFVCKLNPATTGEGLAMCFRQFGAVVSADVVRDARTGNSLCYAFVEFESADACFRAFQKMDRALVDDCRIHVDFSQSVSKLWFNRRREMRKRGRGTAATPHAE